MSSLCIDVGIQCVCGSVKFRQHLPIYLSFYEAHITQTPFTCIQLKFFTFIIIIIYFWRSQIEGSKWNIFIKYEDDTIHQLNFRKQLLYGEIVLEILLYSFSWHISILSHIIIIHLSISGKKSFYRQIWCWNGIIVEIGCVWSMTAFI